jgi:hypothetical protein
MLTDGQILDHHIISMKNLHRPDKGASVMNLEWIKRNGGMRHGLFAAVAAVLLTGNPLRIVAAQCGDNNLTVAESRAAVAFVRDLIHDAHYLPRPDSVDPALAQLSRLARSISTASTSSLLAHRMNIALAADGDGHLRLELPPDAAASCPLLPVTFAWTEDGLLVLPGGEIPTGAHVLSIAGRSLSELEALGAEAIPHENAYWVHSTFAREIVRADILRAFGLADPDGSVEVVYRTVQGTEARIRLRQSGATKPKRAWVGYELYPPDSTAVLWLERCELGDEFFSTLAKFIRDVKQQNLRKVVIDLRGNPGGDSGVAVAVLRSLGLSPARGFSVDVRVSAQLVNDIPMFAPSAIAPAFQAAGLTAPAPGATRYTLSGRMVLGALAQRLGDRPFETVFGRSLYVLTDAGTFSSAALFAGLVRDNGIGTLVGEPTGNAATFNGSEIERTVPKTPYVLHVSTARLARPDEWAGPAPTLLPDFRAPQTAAGLGASLDPAIELVRRR